MADDTSFSTDEIAGAFFPVSTFWVGKLILDTVLAARAGQASYATLWKYVAFEVARRNTRRRTVRGS